MRISVTLYVHCLSCCSLLVWPLNKQISRQIHMLVCHWANMFWNFMLLSE